MPVDERLYPVNLVLRGRRCLVVGGGSVASRKVSGLVSAGAEVHVVAPRVCEAIKALAAASPARPAGSAPGGTDLFGSAGSGSDGSGSDGPGVFGSGASVTFEERAYEARDLVGSWLVITATDVAEVNAAVRADGEAARVWVNAADDPSSCSFTLPAVARQGPVMVAVSTSGRSPALASWIKEQVEERIGPEFATLADLLGQARAELQAAGRSTEGVDWRPALNWDMLEEIRSGDLSRARKRLEACLSSSLD
jgi:precorrin-2 dehydrogenase / sirohydrochlorin ferrochelatase